MKTVIFITALMLIIYSGVFISGILQEPDHVIEKTINIEVPEAVVFNTMIDFNHYQDWCVNLVENRLSSDYTSRQVRYSLWPIDLILEEKVEINLQKRTIVTRQAASNPSSYLHEFRNDIRMSSLSDGTTNVIWRVSYRVEPIYAKFLNMVLIKPQLEEVIEQNLQGLNQYMNPQ